MNDANESNTTQEAAPESPATPKKPTPPAQRTSIRIDPATGQRLPEKARRVRGGVRLATREDIPVFDWIGQIFADEFDGQFDTEGFEEGHAYAKSGQTKSITIDRGGIAARVQGRRERAYNISVSVPTFSADDIDKLTDALAERAIHGARIIDSEVTKDTYTLFESLGIRLIPSREECVISCGCEYEQTMCKHVRCLVLVLAELFDKKPMELFKLRGIDTDELTDNLRKLRSERASSQGLAAPLPMNGLLPDEVPTQTLEEAITNFWSCGPELDELETPIRPPTVSHALLRRLGPSPFKEAKFPLVGLLATCYDFISADALKEPDEDDTSG